jgi:hypothetical protein
MPMPLPTAATLPYAKTSTPPLTLHHTLLPLENKQARLAGRSALVPDVSIEDYRFRAVIDWIEIQVHLGRPTQAQYVQDVLRQHLNRNCHIVGQDEGPGCVFSVCTIRVQEPASFALIATIHQSLVDTFGAAAGDKVTEMEVSIDVYPKVASDTARAIMLGTMQRTIWTDRDIWSSPRSRPRYAFSSGGAFKLSPPPNDEVAKKPVKRNRERITRVVPDNHDIPSIDGTMYLGAQEDDVLIRLMDKIIDTQNPNGTHSTLPPDQRRVRIEVRIKGSDLTEMGVTDIQSLSRLRMASLQKRYFQFRLPTFSWRDNPMTGAQVLHNTRQEWRAQTYLRAGVTGLIAMEMEGAVNMSKASDQAKPVLNALGKNIAPSQRRAPAFVSYETMNRKMTEALVGLSRREETAWDDV